MVRSRDFGWPFVASPVVILGEAADGILCHKKIPTGWVGIDLIDLRCLVRGGKLLYSNSLHSRKHPGIQRDDFDT